MSEETEQVLRNWAREKRNTCDAAHIHFSDLDRWDWCEVADEGLRVWNMMFNHEVEAEAPIDAVISAVAAQAAHGAFASIAAALGIDVAALKMAVADWSEKQDELKPPVTPHRLMELVAENTQN